MIRITKYFKIHILTVILAIICLFSGYIKYFLIVYSAMLLHETAHLVAALWIGLRVSHITLYPFGVNLKLKNKMVYSVVDDVILYISGPLINIILSLISLLVYTKYPREEIYLFYINNIALFAVNMLPAMPLDGGMILKKILTSKFGYDNTKIIMGILSMLCALLFAVAGIFVLYKTRVNFSVLLFAALLLGNVFTQQEKYDEKLVRELMFHNKKKGDRIRHLTVKEPIDYKKLVKKLDTKDYGIVYVLNSKGKIINILTETEIINNLTESNVTV